MIMIGWILDIYHDSWRGIMVMMRWVLDIYIMRVGEVS